MEKICKQNFYCQKQQFCQVNIFQWNNTSSKKALLGPPVRAILCLKRPMFTPFCWRRTVDANRRHPMLQRVWVFTSRTSSCFTWGERAEMYQETSQTSHFRCIISCFFLRDFEVQISFWISLEVRRRKQHTYERHEHHLPPSSCTQALNQYLNWLNSQILDPTHPSFRNTPAWIDLYKNKRKVLGRRCGRTPSRSRSTSWQQEGKQNLPGPLLKSLLFHKRSLQHLNCVLVGTYHVEKIS